MDKDSWIKQSISSRKLLTKVPGNWSLEEETESRRKVLAELTETDFSNLENDLAVLKAAKGRNIEQAIGVVKIPLGIAGPLKIKGDWIKGNYFLPLATTEGALVASVNRGCKAIWESGGTTVDIWQVGTTRGPVFRVDDLIQGKKLEDCLEKNFKKIKVIARRTSRHLQLKSFQISGVGKYRYIRFVFDTQEAMGMNMATIATDAIVNFIKKESGIRCVSLSGNFCVDKKPAWQNAINGRGYQVKAEVVLPAETIKKILKTTSRDLYEVWLSKCMIGSALTGSMAFNAHFANIIAAVFLATGQDMAQVVEGSLGITTMEVSANNRGKEKSDLYLSIYLPDLMIGTVGGGTHLPSQKVALGLMGLGYGKAGEAKKLAEIIGGAVLAGELSLLAALAEGSLARTHQSLGRAFKEKADD